MRLKHTNARLCILNMREIFDAYLKRRLNIIKAFVGVMDKFLAPAIKKLRVNAEIVPLFIG